MRSQQRVVAEPRQQAAPAATVTTIAPTPRGIMSRPTRWAWAANQAWKSLGARLFQKLTSATPITSMPPDRKPSTRHVRIRRVEATTDRPAASRLLWRMLTFPLTSGPYTNIDTGGEFKNGRNEPLYTGFRRTEKP